MYASRRFCRRRPLSGAGETSNKQESMCNQVQSKGEDDDLFSCEELGGESQMCQCWKRSHGRLAGYMELERKTIEKKTDSKSLKGKRKTKNKTKPNQTKQNQTKPKQKVSNCLTLCFILFASSEFLQLQTSKMKSSCSYPDFQCLLPLDAILQRKQHTPWGCSRPLLLVGLTRFSPFLPFVFFSVLQLESPITVHAKGVKAG